MATKYGAYWGSRQTLQRGSTGGSVGDLFSGLGDIASHIGSGIISDSPAVFRDKTIYKVVEESDTIARVTVEWVLAYLYHDRLVGTSFDGDIPETFNISNLSAFVGTRGSSGGTRYGVHIIRSEESGASKFYGYATDRRPSATEHTLLNRPITELLLAGVPSSGLALPVYGMAVTSRYLYLSVIDNNVAKIIAYSIPTWNVVPRRRTGDTSGPIYDELRWRVRREDGRVTTQRSYATRTPARDLTFSDKDNVGPIYAADGSNILLARSKPHPRINAYTETTGAYIAASSFDIDNAVETIKGITLSGTRLAVLDGDSIRYFVRRNVNIPEYSPRADSAYLELYHGTRHTYTFPALAVTPAPTYPVTFAARGLPQDSTYDPATHTVVVDGTDEPPGTLGLMVETATAISGTASFSKPYRVHAQTAAKWSTPTVSVEFQKDVDIGAQALGAMLAGGPQPTVTVVGNLPAGVTFDTSLLRFNPGAATVEGNGSFVLRAVNTLGSDNLTVNWRVYGAATAPVWTVTDLDALEWVQNRTGQRYVVPNPGGLNPAPIFTARDIPPGMTFNPATRAIEDVSPATGPTDVGDGTAIITATQTPIGGGDPLVIEFHVPWRVAAAVAPKWDATALRKVVVTHQYRSVVHLPVVDAGYPTPAYSVTLGPAGMAIDYDSGKLALDGEPSTNDTTGTATITALEGTSSDTITLPWEVRSVDHVASDQEWWATPV